ncbi:MAG: ribonuclease H-like domain-containing protein [Lentisphaeria bacterium]|nr:ribonuclease H-like domain-containing protein [Lentisphaeria bacterium]
MITGALHHLPGIGPKRREQLLQLGVSTWDDFGARPPCGYGAGTASWSRILDEIERCRQALAEERIDVLVRALAAQDRWRILSRFFSDATYFDIETTGLEMDCEITVVVCLHRGAVRRFVLGENLNDFLDLLDDVRLLVSFNGSTFDVPFVERYFHIPKIPCPHLDLRWLCHRAGLTGGLKQIEWDLGMSRPSELEGVDGAEAVRLWWRWRQARDRAARERLVRYCSADVVTLRAIAAHVVRREGGRADDEALTPDWTLLSGSETDARVGEKAQSNPVESDWCKAEHARLRRHLARATAKRGRRPEIGDR